MAQINVKVNARSVSRNVEDRTLLVEFLRETDLAFTLTLICAIRSSHAAAGPADL